MLCQESEIANDLAQNGAGFLRIWRLESGFGTMTPTPAVPSDEPALRHRRHVGSGSSPGVSDAP